MVYLLMQTTTISDILQTLRWTLTVLEDFLLLFWVVDIDVDVEVDVHVGDEDLALVCVVAVVHVTI